jgi:hypothetical protein
LALDCQVASNPRVRTASHALHPSVARPFARALWLEEFVDSGRQQVASILINFHYAGERLQAGRYPTRHRQLQRVLKRDSFRKAFETQLPAAKSVGALDLNPFADLGYQRRHVMFRIGDFSRIARVSCRLLR